MSTEGHRSMLNGFQAEADRLNVARPGGRFTSRPSLREATAQDAIVHAAVARAKQGDREALHGPSIAPAAASTPSANGRSVNESAP